MATVGQICVREVVTVTRDANIADAARKMRDRHVGSLVVVETRGDAERPIGIITDRDIVVEVCALDLDPHDVAVGELLDMGVPLVTVDETEDVRDALEAMRHHGLRRMPVLSSRRNLLGIVSSDDIIQVIVNDLNALASISPRERKREAATRRPVSV